jgi:hypothetical protein
MGEATALLEALAMADPPVLQCSAILPVPDVTGNFLNYGLGVDPTAAKEHCDKNASDLPFPTNPFSLFASFPPRQTLNFHT